MENAGAQGCNCEEYVQGCGNMTGWGETSFHGDQLPSKPALLQATRVMVTDSRHQGYLFYL